MAKEIERKFLVTNTDYRRLAEPVLCRQGYISTQKHHIVRVRLMAGVGLLTLKGTTEGISRSEFEYEIPPAQAKKMLEELCIKPVIEKYRYELEHDGLSWVVDEFCGPNEGLVLAEVHLDDEHQQVNLPEWVGEEVSYRPEYFNSNLVQNPYCKW